MGYRELWDRMGIEVEWLVGPTASKNNLLRQKQLIYLLRLLEELEKIKHTMSADQYLNAINRIDKMLKGTQ